MSRAISRFVVAIEGSRGGRTATRGATRRERRDDDPDAPCPYRILAFFAAAADRRRAFLSLSTGRRRRRSIRRSYTAFAVTRDAAQSAVTQCNATFYLSSSSTHLHVFSRAAGGDSKWEYNRDRYQNRYSSKKKYILLNISCELLP